MSTITIRAEIKVGAARGPLVSRSWLRRAAGIAWRGLREWCGDAAYDSYLRSKRTRSSSSPPLSPSEFYVEQLDRRYSRPNRCC